MPIAATQPRGGALPALSIAGFLLLELALPTLPARATSPTGAAPRPMGATRLSGMDARPAPAAARAAPSTPPPRDAMAAQDSDDAPPPDAELLPPEERPYERIRLEVVGLRWLGPGQQGLIEAHPLVMGLAAMALATVALIFFFLRGVKRPRPDEP